MVDIGDPAPDFGFTDHNGEPVTLASYRGEWLVLWWYPEANTPGCSRQAASLQQHLSAIDSAGAVVLGASFDEPQKNNDFACDKELSIRLLSDPKREAGAACGVVRDAEDASATRARRHTFVIDPLGRIAYKEDATEVDLSQYGPHIIEVLHELRAV